MATVIGVTFRRQCKVYYFDPNGLEVKKGEGVIVETAQGMEFGDVMMGNRELPDDKIVGTLKPIIRIATDDDRDQRALNEKNERDAIRICREKVAAHHLEMKLIRAEYAFDRTKLTFYFTADGRVDFRELVKDLAYVFRTRIELRQVGVRDETKMLGGIGSCGRALCCATWLPDFVPVSIKMAKEQNLSLNSAKISGVCGRLMCCLKNEQETYEYLNAKLPDVNSFVKAKDGASGQVKSVDVLRQRVHVLVSGDRDEKEIREYGVEEIEFTPSTKKKEKAARAEEEKELKKLEG
ncbi:MAG: stage 0 sporulation family protein [Lachnospiraceae bacterium]|nr:stage 0 sporulation family protein [Lachnospiraceae bacterium]